MLHTWGTAACFAASPGGYTCSLKIDCNFEAPRSRLFAGMQRQNDSLVPSPKTPLPLSRHPFLNGPLKCKTSSGNFWHRTSSLPQWLNSHALGRNGQRRGQACFEHLWKHRSKRAKKFRCPRLSTSLLPLSSRFPRRPTRSASFLALSA